ncbi:MAG: NgoFVII family restriction endonuclease [Gammaproteobacteria bacterium]|nr:NgoFVII family restriction endonuclease [Gammaproteobacteria bacterium]
MFNNELFDTILLNPVDDYKADKIVVVSGYASSAMAYKHLAKLNERVSIDLVIGMAKLDGIGYGTHVNYKKLSIIDYPDRFRCSYYTGEIPIHSKSYIWLSDDKPVCAYTGSANYSQRAFFNKTQEAMVGDDPDECLAYFNDASKDSINCLDVKVEDYITLYNEVRSKSLYRHPSIDGK